MYHDERATSLMNCLSCLSSVLRNLFITTKPACGKFSRAISPRCSAISSLPDARLPFCPLLVERSQKSNIKRDRPERAFSRSPSLRRGSREYFAMLIAKWTHHFSCTSARECVYPLFAARYWLCISVIILTIASWERITKKNLFLARET